MKILVDSDILIEVTRGKNAEVLTKWQELSESGVPIFYSPVTAAELWAGARPSEYTALSALFGALSCAPVDYETGRKAGNYLHQFNKSHSLELGDALIGAAAAMHGAELWTRNRKHYPMKDVSFFS